MSPWRLAVILGGVISTAAVAQSRASGTVRRPDSAGGMIGVPSTRVVLHKIGRATQGPVDTTVTDARGRFDFGFAPDTTASFLVSARFAGIEYFSAPLAINPRRPDTAVALVVFDTSGTAPVGTRSRTVIVAAPDGIGTRTVIDWLVIANRGQLTRVAPDSLAATWSALLPVGARNPRLGDPRLSQVSPDAVLFRGDSVLVTAPIAPGDKELLLQYELPATQPWLRLDLAAIDSVDVFLEETGVAPPSTGWVVSDSQAFEGRRFRRLSRMADAAAVLDLRLPGIGIDPRRLLPWLVGVVALGLTILGWRLVTRATAPNLSDPTHIADQILELDRQLAEPTTADRVRLEADRVALMRQLRETLAGPVPPS